MAKNGFFAFSESLLALRPFRARGYPVLPAIVFVVAGVLLIAFLVSSVENSLYAAVGIAVSYPVYRLVKKLVESVAV